MCNIWAWALLLLVALLLIGAYWILRRSSPPRDPVILGITASWRKALEEPCVTPAALSKARADCLLERIGKAEAIRPDLTEAEAWIQQARMIMEGDYEGLREFQARRYPFLKGDPGWLIAAGILLLIALLLMLYCPRVEPPCNCPPRKDSIDVPTDMLFEYDKSTIRFPDRLRSVLQTQLKGYRSVRVTSIQGYADPIGGYCHNDALASARAQAIRDALSKIPLGTDGQPPELPRPSVQSNFKDFEDVPLWEACFAEFQTRRKPEQWPLYTEQPDRVCKSPTDGMTNPAPEQPWPKVKLDALKSGNVTDIVERARNQRDLIGCLASMRRVKILIEGVPAQEASHGR